MDSMPCDHSFDVDPVTLQRLWPVIDVYGRIARVLAGAVLDADPAADTSAVVTDLGARRSAACDSAA